LEANKGLEEEADEEAAASKGDFGGRFCRRRLFLELESHSWERWDVATLACGGGGGGNIIS
jgi:hypothetical protein